MNDANCKIRGRNGGIASVLKSGRVPIIHTQVLEDRCIIGEIEFADMLAKGCFGLKDKKMPNEVLYEITRRVNDLYHGGRPVRKEEAMRIQIGNYRRNLRYLH